MTPVDFFKCLADDIRLTSILLILKQQELCVCELMAALDEPSQPKISRHLAQLKKQGVLCDRKQQQWVFYTINPELAPWQLQTIKQVAEQNKTLLTKPLQRLTAMGSRPERVKQCCN